MVMSEHGDPSSTAGRAAVTAVFFLNGFVLSSWVTRIPATQERLGLSDGQLGLALLGPPLGAIVSMVAAGRLINRFGSRPVVTGAFSVFALALIPPALSVNLATLFLALLALGITNGMLDVSMNAQGVAVERRARRPILSSFHAAFSFGGLTGAAFGGIVTRGQINPLPHFVLVVLVVLVAGLLACRRLLPAVADRVGRAAPVEAGNRGSRWRHLPVRLLLIGVVGFCCLVGEGAMGNWTAVYLHTSLATSQSFATVGYIAFSLTMAIGRLGGDWLALHLGPVRLVRSGGVLVVVALGVALPLGHPIVAIMGFAVVGIALSGIIPVVFSAAGQSATMAPGPAIATVSTLAYTGLLAGPPIIGGIAEATSLPVALGFVVAMGVTMAALSGSLRPPEPAVAGNQPETIAAVS